jgi:hypothetical protein
MTHYHFRNTDVISASSTALAAPSVCGPFREFTALGLSRGRNAMAIWQDFVAETVFRGGLERSSALFASCEDPAVRDHA